MGEDDLLEIELTAQERALLRHGLIEWGGPARCTEEMAVAMGFDSVEHLFEHGKVLVSALRDAEPLRLLDWCRTLLATEIVFASNIIGSGHDWDVATGMSDEESLATLRRVQAKMPHPVYRVLGAEFGTRPRRRRDA